MSTDGAGRVGVEATPAGREMDALVAERVLRLEKRDQRYHDGEYAGFLYVGSDGKCRGALEAKCNWFSTRIDAAWEVVETMRERGWYPDVFYGANREGPYWGARLDRASEDEDGNGGRMVTEYAETAPLAICRAALAATASEPLPPE